MYPINERLVGECPRGFVLGASSEGSLIPTTVPFRYKPGQARGRDDRVKRSVFLPRQVQSRPVDRGGGIWQSMARVAEPKRLQPLS